MKISNVLNNLIKEALTKKDLEALKDANIATYPNIPVENIFFHECPEMSTILDITNKGVKDNEDGGKGFKLEKVNVKMIVPTQKNVNADNLQTTDEIGPDTNAELVKYEQFYFILDGHHRIANAILQGLDEIEAYVYTDKGINESVLDEDYPQNFSMDEFKQQSSFNGRIKYCQERLKRISSGSSRIVYQIDDEKVLKLAKNKKGLAQNEVETQYSDSGYPTADIFDYHEYFLWTEMELARPLTPKIFQQITGFNWLDYEKAINNYGIDANGRKGDEKYKVPLNPEIMEAMWEDEFVYSMFSYIGDTHVPVGDLKRLNSYGVVKREGHDTIVIIDYGLTDSVYGTYYS